IAKINPVMEVNGHVHAIVLARIRADILAGCSLLLPALEMHLPSTLEENTPVTQKKEFVFITNHEVRRILERDYIEIQRAFNAQCWKSVIILSGGAIEAILTDRLLQNQSAAMTASKAPKGKTDITKWDFADLINVSVELHLIGNAVETF